MVYMLSHNSDRDLLDYQFYCKGNLQKVSKTFRSTIAHAKKLGYKETGGIDAYNDIWSRLYKDGKTIYLWIVSEKRARIMCPEIF